MKIDSREIRELMRLALAGRIDKNDLTGTEKANILHYARQDYTNGMRLVNQLMLSNANPEADPESETKLWVNRVPAIRDALILIEWLEPTSSGMLMRSLNLDGALKLKDEINSYLNNWQSVTKAGLELRSRQVRESINGFEQSLIDPADLKHLSIVEIEQLKSFIDVYSNLLTRINIRLEKYANLPEQPVTSKKEPITYQWTKQPDRQLPKLYQRLIDGGFIDPQTSSEAFTACFTGQPVKSITEKIKWLESKVLLAYFLDNLIIGEKIPQKTKLWSISKIVFDDAANLKQAKGNFVAYGYPDRHDRIDQILSDL